jgi:hypothetical protein
LEDDSRERCTAGFSFWHSQAQGGVPTEARLLVVPRPSSENELGPARRRLDLDGEEKILESGVTIRELI